MQWVIFLFMCLKRLMLLWAPTNSTVGSILMYLCAFIHNTTAGVESSRDGNRLFFLQNIDGRSLQHWNSTNGFCECREISVSPPAHCHKSHLWWFIRGSCICETFALIYKHNTQVYFASAHLHVVQTTRAANAGIILNIKLQLYIKCWIRVRIISPLLSSFASMGWHW